MFGKCGGVPNELRDIEWQTCQIPSGIPGIVFFVDQNVGNDP
jgi:hypothetical protein